MNTEIIIILAKLKKMKQEYINNKELTNKEIETIYSELERIEGLIATGGISVEEINNMIKVQIDELQKVVNEDLIALKEELEIEIEDNTDNISNMVDVVVKLNENINRIDLKLIELQKEHNQFTLEFEKLQKEIDKISKDLADLAISLGKLQLAFDNYKEVTDNKLETMQNEIDNIKNNGGSESGLSEEDVRLIVEEYTTQIDRQLLILSQAIEQINTDHPTFVDLTNLETKLTKEMDTMEELINNKINTEVKRLEDLIESKGNGGDNENEVDLKWYAKLNFIKEDGSPVDYYIPADIYVLRENSPVSDSFYDVKADEKTYYDSYFTPKMSVLSTDNIIDYTRMVLGFDEDNMMNINISGIEGVEIGMTLHFNEEIKDTKINSINNIDTEEFIKQGKFPLITFKMDYSEYSTGLFRRIYQKKFNKIYEYSKKELELYGINVVDNKKPTYENNIELGFYSTQNFSKIQDIGDYWGEIPLLKPEGSNIPKFITHFVRKELLNTNPLFSLRNTPSANQDILDIDVTQLIKPPSLNKAYQRNLIFNVGYVHYTREKITLPFNGLLDGLNNNKKSIDIFIDEDNIENDTTTYLELLENDESYGWQINSYNYTKEKPFKMKSSNIVMKGDINPNIILLGHTDKMYVTELYQQMVDILSNSSSQISLVKDVEKYFENKFFYSKSIDGKRVTGVEEGRETEIGLIPQIKLSTPFDNFYDDWTETATPVQYIFSVMNNENSAEHKIGYTKYNDEKTTFDKLEIDKNILYKNVTEDLGITGDLMNSSYEGKGKKINFHKSITPKDRNDLSKVYSNIYEYLINKYKYEETTILNIFNDLSNITDSFKKISYMDEGKSLLPSLNILNGKFSVVKDLKDNIINVINDKVLMQVTKEGNLRIGGQLESNYADYSEMFELQAPLGNNDKLAKIVKLNSNGKVELTSKGDTPLGIISVNASVVGNNPIQWNNKYILDKYERLIEKYTLAKSPYVFFDSEEETTIFVNSINKIMSEIENEIIEKEIIVYKENETTGEMEHSTETRTIKNKVTLATVLPKLSINKETEELNKLEEAITKTDFNTIQSIRELHLLLDKMQLLEEKKLAVLIAMYAENKLKLKEEEDNESDSEVIGNDNISIEYGNVYNIDYDFDQEYEMREHRDEWAKVGIMGQLMLHVEEKVNVGDYITTGNNGYGIKSTEPTNIKVMEVIDEDLVKVYFK